MSTDIDGLLQPEAGRPATPTAPAHAAPKVNADAAPAPRSRPAAASTAVLLAVLLLAAGAVVIADAAGSFGSTGSLAEKTFDGLDGLKASGATTGAGAALAVIGLLLVIAALKPRGRTHLAVDGPVDLWVTPRAAATIAAQEAEEHPDVLEARVESANRRRITLVVTPRSVVPDTGLAEAVRTRVSSHLAPVSGVARVVVKVEEE
ncbi:DUF6286 domain-containing protein [Nocardioides sp.]|uniref:DUF6286 domain-containing protein n=1 Tax=Nocardioides sp. TaxID=35761 RepID=UPI003512C64F